MVEKLYVGDLHAVAFGESSRALVTQIKSTRVGVVVKIHKRAV